MTSTFVWYFLSLSGRVSRQEFRLGYLGLLAVGVVINRIVAAVVFHGRSGFSSRWDRAELDHALRLPSSVVLVILLWPLVAILIKRLHDLNLCGWWSVAVLAIPFVAPQIHIAPWVLLVIVLAIVSSLPGSPRSNRFGASPRPLSKM